MMKRILLSTLILFPLSLFSDDPACNPPPYPIGLSGMYLNVQKAEFRTPGLETQHLHYKQGNAAFAYTHACNPYWGLIFGAGYVGTEVKWEENPYFKEEHFSYVDLNFGAYTNAMPDWCWTLTGSMFADTAVLDLRDYALYQGVLYGKYDFLPCLNLDFGFILEVGLNKAKIWPIFGFEFEPTARLSINIVYPLDVSIKYAICSWLDVAGAARFLRDRHRFSETASLPKGVYEYTAEGVEFDLIASPLERMAVTLFAGSTFPGDLKITNSNNHPVQHAKFRGSFYSGISGTFAF